ncbi:DUF5801 repeats-in-toxin domain-containing protein, partial [Legionella sp. 29fVS95]
GNVVFDDDGPSISVTATDGNLILLNTQDAQTIGAASDVATASFAAAFTAASNFGADGAGSVAWTYHLNLLASAGVDSGLKSDGQVIHLYNI